MAIDAFLKIDGIPGESTDGKHKDWIEIEAFDLCALQPVSSVVSSAGGATAGRVDHQDLLIRKLVDKATPKLFEACNTGKHIKEISIEFCRAGGDKQKYLEVKLEQVIISKFNVSLWRSTEFPSEEIKLNYGKITVVYTQQKRADGIASGNVSSGWNLITNKATA